MMKKLLVMFAVLVGVANFSVAAEETLTIQPYIANGIGVSNNTYPSFVAINIATADGDSLCGGTLISSQWVLTAAHCLKISSTVTGKPEQFTVGLYPTGVENEEIQAKEWISVRRVIAHPAYSSGTTTETQNDIGLLQLSKAVSTDTVRLNGSQMRLVGQQGTIVGIGVIEEEYYGSIPISNAVYPTQLQAAEVPIIDLGICKNEYQGQVDDKTLCVGILGETAANVCSGDSGGPLYVNRNGKKVQVGLTSGGYQCGTGHPSTFTDISYFKTFIKKYVSDAVFDGNGVGLSVSGSWYDPAYSGMGFNVAEFSNGVFAYFYGYKGGENGEAQWLLTKSGIPTPIEKGKIYHVDLVSGFIGNGASFTAKPNNNSGVTDWGTMKITFNSCSNGVAELNGKDGKLTHNITKLASIVGTSCSE